MAILKMIGLPLQRRHVRITWYKSSGKRRGCGKLERTESGRKLKTLLEKITIEVREAFQTAGYDEKFAKVTLSNRPDLCEYQCNGAMAAAKTYKKAPAMIAKDVVEALHDSACFETAEAVNPGFINLKVKKEFVTGFLNEMAEDEMLGVSKCENQRTVMIDYGGPNVAKPLHVGHLRSAIIGESIKRIIRYKGNTVIGDIHLGDWGYQMGLIITELKKRKPDLPYFDESFEGDYPKEAPFTITELEEIYPTASAYAKEHEDYREEALKATYLLQNGHRGYRAVWEHIMHVSVTDLKKNYQNLHVEFDLWKGEADAQKYIPPMVEMLKEGGYAHYDEGALVVDVQEESDKKEVPPCMILKSDGAALYDTTDLATLVEREKLYQPDEVIYVVDKRQEMHFIQVFRCAKKTGIVKEETALKFLGFGTMNGKDGKPFKTREGGVMRLENLIREINEEMYKKIMDNRTVSEEEAKRTAQIVGLAAIKYGDLSNQAGKDYIFDVDRFTSFEGNTGPYILYTIVRIKSILTKYAEDKNVLEGLRIGTAQNACEKTLMLEAAKFNDVIDTVYEETAPHKICAYIYDLANAFNKFYHETKILSEEDEQKKESYIALLVLTRKILETSIDLLGFTAPERM
nr:arginine--tRNA ligase [Mediterraneibacter massiliensis]